MNENDLPSNINNNPWINNNIRKKLNINNEDLEYALEAQIFAQLLCNKDVIITHSSKYGNENKLPSVWLKRIYHLYNANKISINDSKYYSLLLKSINSNEYSLEDIVLDPKYQIKDLPDMLSVTSLTRLKDIPYQFYCNNILRLYQMNDINETITPRVIGEITHKMIEYYFNYNEKDENKIFNIISEEYRYNKDNNNKIQNIYRKEIIKKYIYSINNINKDNNEIKPEFQVVYNIKNEFNISINARIDCLIHNNETAEIIDFKTGKFQSISKKNTSIVSNIQLSFGALAVHKIMNLDIKKVSIFGLKEKQYVIDSCNVNHDIYESIENNIIEILKPYYIDNEKIKFNFKTINNPYMKIYIHYSRCYF